MTDLASLLALLPECNGPKNLPLAQNQKTGLQYSLTPPEAFVPPPISDSAFVTNPSNPQIAIVSAAGAVGKSTLARHIAHQKSAPLWDLAQGGPVAQHSLAGVISDSFSATQIGHVYAAFQGGKLFVVIDALDEARIKINEAAFFAFLDDVARLAGQYQHLSFLLLGRTQISETAWLVLQDAGVRTSLYVLDAFARRQAEDYIDFRARVLSPAIQPTNPVFKEIRDVILDQLSRALGVDPSEDDPIARQVLGYAPVLDAVAIMLAREPNFAALRQRLLNPDAKARTPGEHAPTALLRSVVEEILRREHEQKLVHNLKPALEGIQTKAPWSKWDMLYTPDEQCKRLLALVYGGRFAHALDLPGELAPIYEDRISSWLPEHPFLKDGRTFANPVFESYILARALRDNLGDFRPTAEKRVAASEYRPSKLLADFYLSTDYIHEIHPVPAEHVGAIYDALQSAETDALFLRMTIQGSDPQDDLEDASESAEVEFELLSARNSDEEAKGNRTIAFPIQTGGKSKIILGRYVRDASITVPCTVILGRGDTEYEIGPSVSLRARHLDLLCERLVVGGKTRPREVSDPDNAVILEAQQCEHLVTQRPVVHVPLQVSWPGAEAFPWIEFFVSPARDIGSDPRLHTAYRRFRRIATTLRSHSKGALARYKAKIEHRRVLKGPIGEALLAKMVKDEVLLLRGSFYYWNPKAAERRVGVSWNHLRRGETTPLLKTYLTSFVEQNARLF